MSTGIHVFGDNRRGLWVGENANLTDKLKHYLPRLRGAIPNLTDLFLPPSAGPSHRDQCRAANFFVHMYEPPPHGRSPKEYVDSALARHKAQGTGALEYNVEGLDGDALKTFITSAVHLTRAKKPNLPLRINVVGYKGAGIPAALFRDDPQLYLIIQAYGGNMDYLFPADEIVEEVVRYGVPSKKVSVMHAVMCAQAPGQPRQIVMPQVRNKGSFYIDDLLLDAGLLK